VTLRQAASPGPAIEADTVKALGARLDASMQRGLGRSIAILHLDAGDCGGCKIELRAVRSAVYDLRHFGISFVVSPRQADVLLVTGPVTRNLVEALEQAHAAMPEPKTVVALGDCAIDGGVFKGSYGIAGGAGTTVPVDLLIGGCPPAPERIVAGLRALLEANARRG
jgi:Ni,Fe-hydrogenase III small subunit